MRKNRGNFSPNNKKSRITVNSSHVQWFSVLWCSCHFPFSFYEQTTIWLFFFHILNTLWSYQLFIQSMFLPSLCAPSRGDGLFHFEELFKLSNFFCFSRWWRLPLLLDIILLRRRLPDGPVSRLISSREWMYVSIRMSPFFAFVPNRGQASLSLFSVATLA